MQAGDEFIAFAQKLLDNGAFVSDVSARCKKKFKTRCTRDAIHGLIQRGKLKDHGKPKPTEHDASIISMHSAGFARRQISATLGIKHAIVVDVCDREFGKIEKSSAPKFAQVDTKTAAMMADDPIMDIGFELVDLRANQCHWPVARWPKEYPKQRFCGEQRMTHGPYFASMYCCEHYDKSVRPRVEIMQAAE